VKRALDLLAAVFADPGAGAGLLDELRAHWHDLTPEERTALTPLAKLAAERVRAAPKEDPDGYWASLESAAPPEDADEWSPAAGREAELGRGAATRGRDAEVARGAAVVDRGTQIGRGAAAAGRDAAAAGGGATSGAAASSGADERRAATGRVAAADRGAPGGDRSPTQRSSPVPEWRSALPQSAAAGGRTSTAAPGDRLPHPRRSPDPARRPEGERPDGAPAEPAQLALGGEPAPAPASLPGATAESLLSLLGLTAFRPGQREAVQAALDGRDALVVMPTGGGKSLCYQLPALASRDLTVVVSPLIALMRDQCARLTDLGHPAVMLASGEDNAAALHAIRQGAATVVFAAPERFASTAFRTALSTRRLALFVVDEAHCVSEWGHDFRPDYLRLATIIEELGHPPTMACTATATPKVAEEIVARLNLREPERIRSGFDRPNLSFDVLPFDGEGSVARKKATLIAGLQQPENRPAVVYCGTRKSTEEIAQLLSAEGLHTTAYHAGMPADARTRAQDAFMTGQADVVVATNAFGMGVDKADVRSVWHWALPSSLEAYYQEAGRAGRDGEPAKAVLLASRSDLGRLVRFIREAEVTVEQVGRLVNRLRSSQGDLEFDPGNDKDRILLAVAERAGALALQPGTGNRIRVHLTSDRLDRARVAQLCRAATDRRWQSYRSIERYAATGDRCRRRQLLDHFGDQTPGRPEGRCCDVHDPPTWLPPITAKPKKLAPIEDGPPVSDDELAPLKAWRRERAEGKPAYTVATDATLREVIRRKPRSERELLQIKGIGASFISKHADSLLELLETTQ
jgi:RecQ family ATP-dependent DNA helicase